MYSISVTGKPEGVLNDYDLASWDKFPTTNSDRTGTVPFMALNMLRGGLEQRIPRLYSHDAESFIWVLAYVTLVSVHYNGRFVKISRPLALNSWFAGVRVDHIQSKQALPGNYDRWFPVNKSHKRYSTITRNLIDYWALAHCAWFDARSTGSAEPEIDDPKGALESLIEGVEAAFKGNVPDEFKKLNVRLRKATGTPEVE